MAKTGRKPNEQWPEMAGFQWTAKKHAVALGLAEGHTQQQVAAQQGVGERSIRRWLAVEEFRAEVDRLSQMMGIAAKAERMRIIKSQVREKMEQGSQRDLLDWLKFAQSETDGLRLGLAEELMSRE